MGAVAGRSVLVIDGNRDIQDLVRAALEDEGYQVYIADSPSEGRDVLQSKRVHVVLTDPYTRDRVLTDFTLLDILHQDAPDVPIVVFSVLDQPSTFSLKEHGVFAYVVKPFELDRLLTVVDRAVAKGTITEN